MERLARNLYQYSVYEAFIKLFIPDTERSLPECEGDLGKKWYAWEKRFKWVDCFYRAPGCALSIYIRLKYKLWVA